MNGSDTLKSENPGYLREHGFSQYNLTHQMNNPSLSLYSIYTPHSPNSSN